MNIKWHTLSLSDVEQKLGTDFHSGLLMEEAERRLEEYGPNRLPEAKPDSMFVVFLRQFQSPLIYVLLGASVIVFLLGDVADGAIIMFVLLFNAILGSVQEGRAQSTLLALRRFAETNAVLIRGGKEMIVPDWKVVPGDIVILQEGEKIPADARVVESRTLRVDEAAMTGESVPVHKEEAALGGTDIQPAEQKNMVFKGTAVVSGHGKAVVVATGTETVIGKISKAVAAIDTEIPLKKDIRNLARILLIAVALISAFFFFEGLYVGKPAKEMFSVVVAFAVSIIPEGLPVVLTIILAAGVWRMAKRAALVKKLQAVEALGQAKVIAVDKTGTITKNELVIREVFVAGRHFGVGGSGYDPTGEIIFEDKVIDPANHSELLLAGKVAAFCANAHAFFSEETGAWSVSGDPTEAALAVFAEKIGFHKEDLERESPLIYEAAFDYKTKYHLTVHKMDDGDFLAVAGAPEAILSLSKKFFAKDGEEKTLNEPEIKKQEAIFREMSAKGLRVVGFGFAEIKHGGRELELDKLNHEKLNIIFGGFFGMADSLRPEVPEAMRRAREAGIKVIMITGDHTLTAMAIAKEAGIWKEGDKILTGHDLDTLHDEALAQELADVSVFARVTPEHKMKIINAYRKRGEVIAMTGDGVNDAPSLVAADLGVAMGKIGTEVAKEAADIVILDDNFGSIVSAIEEGRNMFKNIQKSVLFLISTGIGEVLVIAGAVFVGFPIPLLPSQIIWLNLVTNPFFGIALALEPKEEGLLQKEFRRFKKGIIDGLMVGRFFVMAIPMTIGSFYLFGQHYAVDIVKAQTIALTALAVFQWFNAWNCRSEEKSIFSKDIFANKYLILATLVAALMQIVAVYASPLQEILGTKPLGLADWGLIILISLSIIVAEEARKAHASVKKKYKEAGEEW